MISDIQMEGMDGLEMMRAAKMIRPDLDFILMTGHAAEYSFSDIIAGGAYDYMFKPFDLGELRAKLRRLQREKALLNRLKKANEALSWEAEVNSTVAKLSRKLMESESLDEMALLVLQNARRLTGSRLGYIGYVDVKSGAIACPKVALKDIDSIGDEDLRKAFEDLAQWALRHGQSLLANGFEDLNCLAFHQMDIFPWTDTLGPRNCEGKGARADSPGQFDPRLHRTDAALLQSLAAIYALATQHLQAALNLRRTNDYLENIFENSPDGIGIVDREGKFLK